MSATFPPAPIGTVFIQCGKCGHTADLDLFTRSKLGIELRRDQFQCPSCRFAWHLVKATGEWRTFPGGTFFVPGEITIQPIAAML